MNSTEHMALLPLDDSWRCNTGKDLYEVNCANKCGKKFGNIVSAGHYSIKDKNNGILVCCNVARGKCSFAICKECYAVSFNNHSSRGRRTRVRSNRLVD